MSQALEQERARLVAASQRLESELGELSAAKTMRAIDRNEFFQRRCVILANLRPLKARLEEVNRILRRRAVQQNPGNQAIAAVYLYLSRRADADELDDEGHRVMSLIEEALPAHVLERDPPKQNAPDPRAEGEEALALQGSG